MRTLDQVEAAFKVDVGPGWVLVPGFEVQVAGVAYETTAVLERTVVVDDHGETGTSRTLVVKAAAVVPDEGGLRWVPTASAGRGGRKWHAAQRPRTAEQCLEMRLRSDERALRSRAS